MEKKADFLNKLLVTFKVEAEEHVRAVSSGLVDLEKVKKAESRRTLLEKIFREVHSLKGAARAVNLLEIETICQSLEDVFSALKRDEVAMSPELFDRLHRAIDHLSTLSLGIGTASAPADKAPIAKIVQEQIGRASCRERV